MKNEDKIVELLAESLRTQDKMLAEYLKMLAEQQKMFAEQQRMAAGQQRMVVEQQGTNQRLDRMDGRLGRLEGEFAKLNLHTGENTRAIFTLAEKVEQVADLHNRVTKLERTVYK